MPLIRDCKYNILFLFEIVDDDERSDSLGHKKIKELRIVDPKSAQNLSILLGGPLKHMTFEGVKKDILRCNDEVLTGALLEQLINYLPPPDQLKRLEELNSCYDDLNEAEQFAVTVS